MGRAWATRLAPSPSVCRVMKTRLSGQHPSPFQSLVYEAFDLQGATGHTEGYERRWRLSAS